MDSVNWPLVVVRALLFLYALGMGAGGVVGYLKAGSKQSLLSGLISGVVLVIAAIASLQNPPLGFSLGAVTALILAIVFGIRLYKTKTFLPAGLLALWSGLMAIVLAVALWLLPTSIEIAPL